MEGLVLKLYITGKSISYISDTVYDLKKITVKGFTKKEARELVEKIILENINKKIS